MLVIGVLAIVDGTVGVVVIVLVGLFGELDVDVTELGTVVVDRVVLAVVELCVLDTLEVVVVSVHVALPLTSRFGVGTVVQLNGFEPNSTLTLVRCDLLSASHNSASYVMLAGTLQLGCSIAFDAICATRLPMKLYDEQPRS